MNFKSGSTYNISTTRVSGDTVGFSTASNAIFGDLTLIGGGPSMANPGQQDSNGDGIGDACSLAGVTVTPLHIASGQAITGTITLIQAASAAGAYLQLAAPEVSVTSVVTLTAFWAVDAVSTTVTITLRTSDEMVLVPAGEFKMGCDPAHALYNWCSSATLPLHTVHLSDFMIDKYEVTNARYTQCVAAGACTLPLRNYSLYRATYYNNPTYASFPVIFVDWNQSSAYCAWAGMRLPTEAEWEKAARGPTPRAWPWGDATPTCALANIWPDPNVNAMCVGDTSTVGRYPAGASPYGALDMAGNVMEWVSDWYDLGYYKVSPVNNPTGPASGAEKVTRGGSFGNWIYERTHVRNSWTPASRGAIFGFRCAKPVGLLVYLPLIRR